MRMLINIPGIQRGDYSLMNYNALIRIFSSLILLCAEVGACSAAEINLNNIVNDIKNSIKEKKNAKTNEYIASKKINDKTHAISCETNFSAEELLKLTPSDVARLKANCHYRNK